MQPTRLKVTKHGTFDQRAFAVRLSKQWTKHCVEAGVAAPPSISIEWETPDAAGGVSEIVAIVSIVFSPEVLAALEAIATSAAGSLIAALLLKGQRTAFQEIADEMRGSDTVKLEK